MKQGGMLIDTTQCVGCYECESACAERWGNPKPDDVHELSAKKNTVVKTIDDVNVSMLCMHCKEPTCASVCPVGAIEKKGNGAVVYDVDKCIGCRYCLQACPFQIPRYEWESLNPKVTKCDFCYERTTQGKPPACVEACQAEARIFGERDELLKEAEKRIREKPSEYFPGVYGAKEAGGTSVLYLSAKPFHQIGLKTGLPEHGLPVLTWNVMSKIPNYVFWSGTLLAGVFWITNRRKDVAEHERRLAEEESKRHPK
jgi:formate dehydrogenase iron-sulfur subunit